MLVGYTATDTLMLDVDNEPYKNVKMLADYLLIVHQLKGYMILRTNKGYHVIFDKRLRFVKVIKLAAKATIILSNPNIAFWLAQQLYNDCLTLRINQKNGKTPKIICSIGQNSDRVAVYNCVKSAVNVAVNVGRAIT